MSSTEPCLFLIRHHRSSVPDHPALLNLSDFIYSPQWNPQKFFAISFYFILCWEPFVLKRCAVCQSSPSKSAEAFPVFSSQGLGFSGFSFLTDLLPVFLLNGKMFHQGFFFPTMLAGFSCLRPNNFWEMWLHHIMICSQEFKNNRWNVLVPTFDMLSLWCFQ